MFFELAIGFGILFGIICAIIASAKNKNALLGFIAGFIFGIFALIYYIFVGREEPKEKEKKYECTGCGAEVTLEEKFCPECGASLEDEKIVCPKCHKKNKEGVKFCTHCGHKLFKEPKPEFICKDCDKKFKSEKELEEHYKHCKKRKERVKKNEKIGFLIGGIIIGVILLVIIINAVTPHCPKSCDDRNHCTYDFCNASTGYECKHEILKYCVGNDICESGEYGTKDCPNCDDENICTEDSIDYNTLECTHKEKKPCIGDGICERGEYPSPDCPNCNDGNKCTKDDYDLHWKKCTHINITPCCGNGVCEEGETYNNCPVDCELPPISSSDEAELVIDRVLTSEGNIDQLRVTVTNLREKAYIPQFDIMVIDEKGKKVCESTSVSYDFLYEKIKPGESKTGDLTIFCIFYKNGKYEIEISLLDENYEILAIAKKEFSVYNPLLAELEELY